MQRRQTGVPGIAIDLILNGLSVFGVKKQIQIIYRETDRETEQKEAHTPILQKKKQKTSTRSNKGAGNQFTYSLVPVCTCIVKVY